MRLAGAGCAHERDALPFSSAEGHVAQDRNAGLVLEVDVLERDRLVGGAGRSAGVRFERGRAHVFLVEELEDSLGPRHRALEKRVALRQQAHRLEELPDVLRECHEQRKGDGVVPDAPQAREPKDACDADGADHLDRGVEDGLVVDGALVRVAIADVDAVELLRHCVLANERLHDRDPVHLLVEEGVQPGRPRADVAVSRPRSLANVVDDRADDGQRQEGHDRQAPVEGQHHRDDADEREEVADRVERARREELAQGVDVVRRARHEPPHRRAIVVAQSKLLEELEDDAPEVWPSRARRRSASRTSARRSASEERRGAPRARAHRERAAARRARRPDRPRPP